MLGPISGLARARGIGCVSDLRLAEKCAAANHCRSRRVLGTAQEVSARVEGICWPNAITNKCEDQNDRGGTHNSAGNWARIRARNARLFYGTRQSWLRVLRWYS